MSTDTDLEQRETALENELTDVKQQLARGRSQKDWRRTVGLSKDDPDFDEMVRLGRQMREQQQANESESREKLATKVRAIQAWHLFSHGNRVHVVV